jgi:putative flavoprotein involved in K+ transport
MAIKHLPPDWVDPLSRAMRRASIPDLASYGLPRPELGVRSSFVATGTTPILDVGIVEAVRRGRVEVVAAVEEFDVAEVAWPTARASRPTS